MSTPAPQGFSHSVEEWDRLGLSHSGRRIAEAALAAILADEHGSRLCAADADWCARTAEQYDRSIGACSVQVRAGVGVLLWLLELLPLFVIGRAARMSRLPIDARVHYFERLEAHSFVWLTVLLIATKLPLTLAAYQDSAELALTGFDRPTTAAPRVKRVLDQAP